MAKKEKLRKSSYFNAVDVGDGSSLLYNGLTSRVDLVPSDVACQLTTSSGWGDFSFLSPEEEHHLVNRGHLTELTIKSEHEQFKKLADHIFRANEELNDKAAGKKAIAFILTYKCNLSCSYCYQNELRKKDDIPAMDEAFVDGFFRHYLSKLFPRSHKKNFSFLLFGGEPLLPGNRGTIERILGYAKKYGAAVSTATNAVMLPAMRDLIGPEAGKIQNVQITLDGEQMFHDRTRIPESGAPTFEDMIRAIQELINVKAHASIRIHLHPNGLESTRALVDYLHRQGILKHQNVSAYFAPINAFDNRDVSPSYLTQFSSVFQRIASMQNGPPSPFARSFNGILDPTATRSVLRARYCSAGTGLLRVVDSRGDVYDCYEEVGIRTRRVAKLSGGEVTYFKMKDTYIRRHILNMPECLKCSVALYCGGGCLSQARLQNGSIFRPSCQQNKDFVGETLKAHYLLGQAGKME